MGQNQHLADGQTRARLLDTARAMVLRGDSKFSVTSLCAEAGVERAVFRAQFSGKTALMAALMAQSASTAEPVPQPAPQAVSTVSQPVSKAEQTSEPGVPTPDAWLERRLRVFERALNALETRADTTAREQARAIAQLQERLDNAAAKSTQAPVPVPATPQTLAAPAPAPAQKPDAVSAIVFAPPPKPTQPAHRVELASAAHAGEAPAEEMQAQAEPVMKPVPDLLAMLPAPVNAASKEEMADVLQAAREKARAAVEPEAPPAAPSPRTRWLAIGAITVVALFLCVGLSLGKNFLGNNANALEKSDGITQRHQASSALAKTTALADAGNPRAQARLALAYLRGQGSAGDANAALLWSMSAARAGDPVAQYLLGAIYQQGDHVKADPEMAFVWFTRAAEKGNLKAMHNLAIAYAHGQGTAKDDAKAMEWFTRAAERGYVDSAFDLAVLYERGIGVRQDLKQSLKWYGVAALAGDAPSKERAHFLRTEMKAADTKLADAAAMAFAPLPALGEANNP